MNLIKGKGRERHYSRKTLLLNAKEITVSKELVAVCQIICKTTKFLGLSPTPEFFQKHFLMKLKDRQTKFSGKKVLILPY